MSPPEAAAHWLRRLVAERRVVAVTIAGEARFAAAEDAARLRDALGVPPPPGLPEAFLEPVADPLGDLVSRYARTHGPFRVGRPRGALRPSGRPDPRRRSSGSPEEDRVVEGEFLPGGRTREWCDAEVLRSLKRRSLAKLRREVEPVEPAAFARFLLEWQGVTRPRAGLDALLSVVEQLQGAAIPASVLETEILPARLTAYKPADLDLLCAAGEVVWRGVSTDRPARRPHCALPAGPVPPPRAAAGERRGRARRRRSATCSRGAARSSSPTSSPKRARFPRELVDALWDLVWAGEVTNDTLAPLRSYVRGPAARAGRRQFRGRSFRSRRAGPPGSEGRWSLLFRAGTGWSRSPRAAGAGTPSETERRAAVTMALLER